MIIIKSVTKLLYQELSVSSKKYYLLEKKEKKKWKEENKKFKHLTKNQCIQKSNKKQERQWGEGRG